ncbi:hypothetical protein FRX31_014737 [Thalictrum thalictroides]|uniref:Uncharacterized protein n=1 Tax=Thalictrum thalictroides TaxID=46969 RepID=A0A7J6WE19_THATH|nr:hypothetical protein FRX31_014737 [Thalictrum thalictroides]
MAQFQTPLLTTQSKKRCSLLSSSDIHITHLFAKHEPIFLSLSTVNNLPHTKLHTKKLTLDGVFEFQILEEGNSRIDKLRSEVLLFSRHSYIELEEYCTVVPLHFRKSAVCEMIGRFSKDKNWSS